MENFNVMRRKINVRKQVGVVVLKRQICMLCFEPLGGIVEVIVNE